MNYCNGTYLWYMSINGVNDSQRTGSHFREHPVDLLLDVAILLRGEGDVVKKHLQSLLDVVHTEIVEGGTIPSPGQLAVLETRGVQHVDGGARFGAQLRQERAVYEHDESIEGLLVEPHHEPIQVSGPTAPHVRQEERAGDGGGVALAWRRGQEGRGEHF